MTDPVNAEDDLVETVARAIGNTLHACGIFKAAAGDPWTDGPSILAARAALEAIRSTRDGEIERLRYLVRQYVDPFNVAPQDHALVLAIGTDDEAGSRQALNQGTDNVG